MRTLQIENYEDYKRVMGLASVDVGSRLSMIGEIKKRAKDKGQSQTGFSQMPFYQLKAILKTK